MSSIGIKNERPPRSPPHPANSLGSLPSQVPQAHRLSQGHMGHHMSSPHNPTPPAVMMNHQPSRSSVPPQMARPSNAPPTPLANTPPHLRTTHTIAVINIHQLHTPHRITLFHSSRIWIRCRDALSVRSWLRICQDGYSREWSHGHMSIEWLQCQWSPT